VFTFNVDDPDVAFLVFRVYDEINQQQSKLIGYAAIPLRNVRTGIRSVAIFDEKSFRKGDHMYCSLLVRIHVETLVPLDDLDNNSLEI